MLFAAAALADSGAESLAARHAAAMKTPQGRAYDLLARRTVFDAEVFRDECIPPFRDDFRVRVRFEVPPDGRVGEVAAAPSGPAAGCIEAQIHVLTFAPAPLEYVAKIEWALAAPVR